MLPLVIWRPGSGVQGRLCQDSLRDSWVHGWHCVRSSHFSSIWGWSPIGHLTHFNTSIGRLFHMFILDRCKKNAHHISYDRNCNNIIAIFQYYLLNITVWFLIWTHLNVLCSPCVLVSLQSFSLVSWRCLWRRFLSLRSSLCSTISSRSVLMPGSLLVNSSGQWQPELKTLVGKARPLTHTRRLKESGICYDRNASNHKSQFGFLSN